MATVTGAWAPNGSTNKRVRLRVEYSVPSPSVGQTSVTVTMRCYIDARYSITDSNNTFSTSGGIPGSWSGSKSVKVATNGSQLLWSGSKSIPIGSSTSTASFAFSIRGLEYIGTSVTAAVSGKVTIPARAQTAPAAPSGVTVSKIHDGRQKVTWRASSSSTAPISHFQIQRWTSVSNGWVTVVSRVGGSARSYEINGTGRDQRVNYRVRAVNSSGSSAWATGYQIVTTPHAADSLRATLQGSSVLLTWRNRSKIASHLDVQVQTRPRGGAWSSWRYESGATGITASAQSWAISGIDPDLEYRWRVQTAANPPALYARSAASNVVSPATPPSAPSLLAPRATVETGQAEFRWRHKPLDSSAQTAAEVEIRDPGGDVHAVTIQGPTDSHTMDCDATGLWAWRVRTRGTHPNYGPWASWADVLVADPPVIEITAPTGEVNASRVTVAWDYTDPEAGQVFYDVTLSDTEGQVLATQARAGSVQQVTIPYTLTDATDYQVVVQVRSGTGLVSLPVSVEFRTRFIPPPVPSVTADWEEEEPGTARVEITNPPGADGVPPAVSNRIERSLDGGDTWATVAEDVEPDGTVEDWQVPLNRVVDYRAVAVSAQGAEAASSTVSIATRGDRVLLRAEDGSTFYLEYNLGISVTHKQEAVVEHYLGSPTPTAHYGEQRTFSLAVTGVLLADEGTFTDGGELLGQNLHYRDPEGRVLWATLGADGWDASQSTWAKREVSLTFTEVEHDG